ncbi:MAG: methyl-accepting chemotaxis protein [Pseudolabrys sp.]
MLRISNISIGIKLMVMSGVSILLVAAMIYSQMAGNSAVKSANQIVDAQQHIALDATNAKSALRGMQVGTRDVRLAQAPANLQAALKYMDERHQSARKYLDNAISKARLPENRERMEKVRSLADQYLAGTKEIAALKSETFQSGIAADRLAALNEQAGRIAREKTLPLAAEMDSLAERAAAAAEEAAKREQLHAEQEMASAERMNLIIAGLAVIALIGSAVFGTVSIARPLVALTRPIGELAEGNFNVTVAGVGRKDEVGQIATAVNVMAGKIRETIGEIKQSAMEVNSASGEISTSTTDLSQRTEEQAASLEETTAAMEEISAAVKKSAENADQANKSAGMAREVADQGGQVVAKAVDAMAKIEDSSRKISDIIGVIDEIARQTNLLALNAAVEAARAGEAGRGFAVVASEVRSLAQRSSQAAKDIKELITNSNGQVQEGVELVNHAGEALAKIVESVKEVAGLVDDIARASTEQSTGLEQINKALMQMDEVTQQNAALVEENAATAKALETQAQSMDEQVAFFKLDDSAVAAQPKPKMAAAPEAPAKKEVAEVKPAARPAEAKPAAAPVRKPAAAAARAQRHPVGRMQTALATALDADTEWKDF